MADIGIAITELVLELVTEPVDPPFSPTDPCRGLIVQEEVFNQLFDGAPPGGDIGTLGVAFPDTSLLG